MSMRRTWVTLVTRTAYLPGALALKASLDAIATAYPLLVLVTPSLADQDRKILQAVGCELHEIEHIPNSSLIESWSSHWCIYAIRDGADHQGRRLLQARGVRSRWLRRAPRCLAPLTLQRIALSMPMQS